jgi:hypothetical protein
MVSFLIWLVEDQGNRIFPSEECTTPKVWCNRGTGSASIRARNQHTIKVLKEEEYQDIYVVRDCTLKKVQSIAANSLICFCRVKKKDSSHSFTSWVGQIMVSRTKLSHCYKWWREWTNFVQNQCLQLCIAGNLIFLHNLTTFSAGVGKSCVSSIFLTLEKAEQERMLLSTAFWNCSILRTLEMNHHQASISWRPCTSWGQWEMGWSRTKTNMNFVTKPYFQD